MQIKQTVLNFRLLIVAFVLFTLGAPIADVTSESILVKNNSNWHTYHDTRFDFSINYPREWYLIPRDDSDLTAKSGIVVFRSFEPKLGESEGEHDIPEIERPVVVIGHYLAEFKGDKTLSNWKEAYTLVTEQTILEIAYEQYETEPRIINGKDALFTTGKSDLLEFQVFNVVNGEIVWFIWAAMGHSTSEENKAIFNQIAESIEFGVKAPITLYDIYGKDFTPQPLTIAKPLISRSGYLRGDSMTINLPSPSNWIVPIGVGESYSVLCGSFFHQDTTQNKYSRYALDIPMYLKSVTSPISWTWISFSGWADGGWGNYVRAVYSDIYDIHYAHLNSINVSQGQWVQNQGTTIGVSGDSGTNPSSYHLHFHVSSLGQSVNLTGMTGFSPNSHYPDGNAPCGQVTR